MLLVDPNHPAHTQLPGIITIDPSDKSLRQDEVIKIGILNLTPKVVEDEMFFMRCLGASGLVVEPIPIRLEEIPISPHAPRGHVEQFYKTEKEVIGNIPLDGLIITGAVVERKPFGDVTFYNTLCSILTYAREHKISVYYSCWAVNAALYFEYEIEKILYPAKVAGVFEHTNVQKDNNIFTAHMNENVWICQSRNSGARESDLVKLFDGHVLIPLFYSPEKLDATGGEVLGTTVFASADGRELFNFGHPEYEKNRLHLEITRDIHHDPPILYSFPNYYENPQTRDRIKPVMWKADSTVLFSNFVSSIRNFKQKNIFID